MKYSEDLVAKAIRPKSGMKYVRCYSVDKRRNVSQITYVGKLRPREDWAPFFNAFGSDIDIKKWWRGEEVYLDAVKDKLQAYTTGMYHDFDGVRYYEAVVTAVNPIEVSPEIYNFKGKIKRIKVTYMDGTEERVKDFKLCYHNGHYIYTPWKLPERIFIRASNVDLYDGDYQVTNKEHLTHCKRQKLIDLAEAQDVMEKRQTAITRNVAIAGGVIFLLNIK